MTDDTSAAAQLALQVAERLLDPDAVTEHLSPRSAPTLSGLAGTALLHARLATVDDRFANAAIKHWDRATVCARRINAAGSGTFSVPGSIAASLILGSGYLPDLGRHVQRCAAAARWLSTHALAIADQHRDRIRSGLSTASWATYDAISGLAGTGRVLMAAVEQGHQHAQPGLDAALDTLTSIIGTRIDDRPGWWLPAEAHPAATAVHPSGAATTGTAHGIAGPLALLAVAHTSGHSVSGQKQAIRDAADWLLRWHEPDTDTWPPHVSGRELDHGTADGVPGRRDAWCYGTPGIAAALILAARAAGNGEYRAVAEHTMRALAARDSTNWDVEGPALCHGDAGVLQAAPMCPDLAGKAAASVMSAVDPRHRYLFCRAEHGAVHEDPGLLTGAAGIALALADHAGLPGADSPGCWDSILLLS
ncbi:lanthionine synthetase LanC family protein [Streptosporangium saharense]|uniref:lanthionine synthetase LanC family protein n=1 Tax=Streptosporangium saharense TaxID=1706840 RepID=UPI003682CE73